MTSRARRVLFFDGPGDLLGSYRHWREGELYVGETAVTYSGQFLNVARRLGVRAHAVAWPGDRRRDQEGSISVEHRPIPFQDARGALFHVSQALWAADLIALAARFRPDVTMLVDTPHPFHFAPLRALGSRVVVALHNTLWPTNRPNPGAAARFIARANGWFFRKHVDVTLALSPECERQVRIVAGEGLRGPIVQYRPKFAGRIVDAPRLAPGRPFRVLFASRVERDKGVLDVVEAAARLHARRPGAFEWIICGGGAAEREVATAVDTRGLSGVVRQTGQLQRRQLLHEYTQCDAVIVPTTAAFAEGMAKVALEGVLAARPVIVSDTVPAGEILGGAALIVRAGDVGGYATAIERLADDERRYHSLSAAAVEASTALLDPRMSFEAVVERTLRELLERGR